MIFGSSSQPRLISSLTRGRLLGIIPRNICRFAAFHSLSGKCSQHHRRLSIRSYTPIYVAILVQFLCKQVSIRLQPFLDDMADHIISRHVDLAGDGEQSIFGFGIQADRRSIPCRSARDASPAIPS